jgi:hypothetical protein
MRRTGTTSSPWAGGASFLFVFFTSDIRARPDDTTPELPTASIQECGCRILRGVYEGCEPLNEPSSRTPLRIVTAHAEMNRKKAAPPALEFQ